MADEIKEIKIRDKVQRYELDNLIWSNYVLGNLTTTEIVNVCNNDLKKRFGDSVFPFGEVTNNDVSSYVQKLSDAIKKRQDEGLAQKIDVVFNIVDELQNIAIEVKKDMDLVSQRSRTLLDDSEQDVSLENRYFRWAEAFHRNITSFKDLTQLLANIQGKFQGTVITLNVVDEKFKEILTVIRDTTVIPNNMKRQLLLEIKDRMDRVRKDLVSIPVAKQVKAEVIQVKPLEFDENKI